MANVKPPKIEAQVVQAIRRLQVVQGSTPREISNYIAQEYNIPSTEIRRHVKLTLKRGLSYGILQRLKGGYYTYNQDVLNGLCMSAGDGIVKVPCHGRRRRKQETYRRGKRRKSRRRSRRRGKSGRRRSSRNRRRYKRRAEGSFAKKMDELESTNTSKVSRSNSLVRKERSARDRSTVSEDSEEKHD